MGLMLAVISHVDDGGGGEADKKVHHMGPRKTMKSLSDKDAELFETFLRMCIQIVFLALGRRYFQEIGLEVNRLFKSDIFNSAKHMSKAPVWNRVTKHERDVLLGRCLRHDQKLNGRSPLMNEIFCDCFIDYRMLGLGIIKYSELNPRLRYMWVAIAGPEEDLIKLGVPCGILGYPRSYFDTMLCVLPDSEVDENKLQCSSASVYSDKSGVRHHRSTQSHCSVKKSRQSNSIDHLYLYGDIALPEKGSTDEKIPEAFPQESEVQRRCSEKQRRLWQNRLHRLIKTGLMPRKNYRHYAVY